jgi:cell division septum initiation protein DivIVA
MNREGLLRAAEARSQELLHEASQHAQALVSHAEEHTEQLKADADAYAAETLRNLKEHLLNVETEISRNILTIEKGLESLGIPSDEQEEFTMEDESDEEAEAFEGPAVQPIPRRASLATDTTGGPTYQ